MTEFQPKFRSIIITDMFHRPAQLLCILSGFYRSMPLLQWIVLRGFLSIPSRSLRKQIRAGISWRTYIVATHILTSCMYNNIQFFIQLQFQLICPIFPQDTFEDFFIFPLCRIIHFFSLSCSKGVSVLLYGL